MKLLCGVVGVRTPVHDNMGNTVRVRNETVCERSLRNLVFVDESLTSYDMLQYVLSEAVDNYRKSPTLMEAFSGEVSKGTSINYLDNDEGWLFEVDFEKFDCVALKGVGEFEFEKFHFNPN